MNARIELLSHLREVWRQAKLAQENGLLINNGRQNNFSSPSNLISSLPISNLGSSKSSNLKIKPAKNGKFVNTSAKPLEKSLNPNQIVPSHGHTHSHDDEDEDHHHHSPGAPPAITGNSEHDNLIPTHDFEDLPGSEPEHRPQEVFGESFQKGTILTDLKPIVPIKGNDH